MELAVRSGVSRNLPFPVHTTWGITTMLVVIPPITCAFGSACRWPGGTMRLTDPLAVTDATSIRTTFIVPSDRLLELSWVMLLSWNMSSVLGVSFNVIHSPVKFNAPVLWTLTELMFITRLVSVTFSGRIPWHDTVTGSLWIDICSIPVDGRKFWGMIRSPAMIDAAIASPTMPYWASLLVAGFVLSRLV